MFNRGSKDRPNWYVGCRDNGRWIYKPSQQPTKAQAKRWVQEIEARVARGHVGIEDQGDAPQFEVAVAVTRCGSALEWYKKRAFKKLDAAIFMAAPVDIEPELLPPRELPPDRSKPAAVDDDESDQIED